MDSRLTRPLGAIACAVMLLLALPARAEQPLTLEHALAMAVSSHPELGVAQADLAAARAESTFASVRAFNPQLDLQSTRGGASLASSADNTVEIGVSQEFERGGNRAARQALANARVQTSAAQWRAKWQELESSVRASFAHALFLQDRLATVQGLVVLDSAVVRATQARVREGSITPVTGRLTDLDLLRVRSQAARAHGDLRQARVALALAIGQPLDDALVLAGELHADTLQASEDSVLAQAVRFRRSVEVLQRRIAERRAELHLAQLEGRANLTLGLSVAREQRSFAHDDFSGASDIIGGIAGARAVDHTWTARVSAPLPLWQRNQAGRARAVAAIGQSEAEYQRDRLQTQMQVVAAVRRVEDAAALYRLYLERSSRVRQDLALMRNAYADGRITLDSYLTQKGRLVDTVFAELEAGDAYWDARGQLESAAGADLARINTGGVR